MKLYPCTPSKASSLNHGAASPRMPSILHATADSFSVHLLAYGLHISRVTFPRWNCTKPWLGVTPWIKRISAWLHNKTRCYIDSFTWLQSRPIDMAGTLNSIARSKTLAVSSFPFYNCFLLFSFLIVIQKWGDEGANMKIFMKHLLHVVLLNRRA